MNPKQILAVALEQSACDLSCSPEDFRSGENRFFLSRPNPRARAYLQLPFSLQLVSYGSNIVASCAQELIPVAQQYLQGQRIEHCFETPRIHALDQALAPFGVRTCFMAEYFLPQPDAVQPLSCPYEMRLLHQPDFQGLYLPEWSNALGEKRPELDVLGVGAYDRGRLIGLAACSADCETMWQIGIDVLPEYRRQCVASALTSRLALAILARDKVPFYCAAWSNVPSVRNAIRSGFRPAWVELTAKPISDVERMNCGAYPV